MQNKFYQALFFRALIKFCIFAPLLKNQLKTAVLPQKLRFSFDFKSTRIFCKMLFAPFVWEFLKC